MEKNEFSNYKFWFGNKKRFLWNGELIKTSSKTQKIRYPNINFRMFRGFSAADFKPTQKVDFDKLPELIKESKTFISNEAIEAFSSVNSGNSVFRTIGKEFFALVSAKNWAELSEIRKRSPVFNFDYEMAEVVSKTKRTSVEEFLRLATAERLSNDPSLVITLIPETELKNNEISNLATPVFESSGIKYYDPALLLNKKLDALPPEFEDKQNGNLALGKDFNLMVVKNGKVKEFINILGSNLKVKLVEDIEGELEEGEFRVEDRSFLRNAGRKVLDKVKHNLNRRQNAIEKSYEVIYSSKGDENTQVYSILKNVASLVSMKAFEEIESHFKEAYEKDGEKETYLLPLRIQYDKIAPQIKDATSSLIAAQLGMAFLKDKDDAQALFEIFKLDMMKSLAQIDKNKDAEWIMPMIGTVVSISLNNAFANVVNSRQFRYSTNCEHSWANTKSFLDIMFQKEDSRNFEGIFSQFRQVTLEDVNKKFLVQNVQQEELKPQEEQIKTLDFGDSQFRDELKKLVLGQVYVNLINNNASQSNDILNLRSNLKLNKTEEEKNLYSQMLSYEQDVFEEHKTFMNSINNGVTSSEFLNNLVDGYIEEGLRLLENDENAKKSQTVEDFFKNHFQSMKFVNVRENNSINSLNISNATSYMVYRQARDLAAEKVLNKKAEELKNDQTIFSINLSVQAQNNQILDGITKDANKLIKDRVLKEDLNIVKSYNQELSKVKDQKTQIDSLINEQKQTIIKKGQSLSKARGLLGGYERQSLDSELEKLFRLYPIESVTELELTTLESSLGSLQNVHGPRSSELRSELKTLFMKDLQSNLSTNILDYVNEVNTYFEQNNITQNHLEAKYENTIIDNMKGYQNSIQENKIKNKWLDELVDQTLLLSVEKAEKDKVFEVKNIQEFYAKYCQKEVSKTCVKVKAKSTYTAQVELLRFKQKELKSDYETFANNKKIERRNKETVNNAKFVVNQIIERKGLKNGDKLFVALGNEVDNLAKESSVMQQKRSNQLARLNEKRDVLNKIENVLICEEPNQKQIEKVFPIIFYWDPLNKFKLLDKTKFNELVKEANALDDKRRTEKRERDWTAVAEILKRAEGKDLTLAQTFNFIENYKKGKTQTAEDKQNIKDLLSVFNYVSFVGDKALDGEQKRIENLSSLEQKFYKEEELKQFKELQEWLHIENNFKRIRSHSKKIGVYEQSSDKYSEEALKINEIYFELTKKIIFAAVENQEEKDYSAKKSSKEISKHYLTKKEVNGFSNSITNEEVLKRKLKDYLPKLNKDLYRHKQVLFDAVCSAFNEYNDYNQNKVSYFELILKQAVFPEQVTKEENIEKLVLRRKLEEKEILTAEKIKEELSNEIIKKLGDCLKLDDEIKQTDLTKEQKELKRAITKTRNNNGFTIADFMKLNKNFAEKPKKLSKEEQDKASYLKLILKQAVFPEKVTKEEKFEKHVLRRTLEEDEILRVEEIKEDLLGKIDGIKQPDLTKNQKEFKRAITEIRRNDGLTIEDLVKLVENSSEELKALAKEESKTPISKQNSKTKIAKEIVNRSGIEDLYNSSQKLAEKLFAKEKKESYDIEKSILNTIRSRDAIRNREKNNNLEDAEINVAPYLGGKQRKLLDDKDKTLLNIE